jgi:hypothetical protein
MIHSSAHNLVGNNKDESIVIIWYSLGVGISRYKWSNIDQIGTQKIMRDNYLRGKQQDRPTDTSNFH